MVMTAPSCHFQIRKVLTTKAFFVLNKSVSVSSLVKSSIAWVWHLAKVLASRRAAPPVRVPVPVPRFHLLLGTFIFHSTY